MSKKTLFFILFAVLVSMILVGIPLLANRFRVVTDPIMVNTANTKSYYDSSDSYLASSQLAEEELINDTEGSKVQKSGSVKFLVDNIDNALSSVRELNRKYSAEIIDIYDSGRGNDRVLTVTVKLPVDDFETYYEDVRKINGEVTYANVSTSDVTEEYIDITSRLANLKNVEGQLIEILQKAQSVTDILAVQAQLNTVRGDIESYEQRKRYFDNRTDYSQLFLSFSIDKGGLSISDEQWKPLGEFRVALKALVSVLKGLINVSIWLLVFSPVILIPVSIGVYIKKRTEQKTQQ